MKSILLACPITQKKAKALYPWLQHIKNIIVPQGYTLDYYFVDTSENYRIKLKAIGYKGVHMVDLYQTHVKITGKLPTVTTGQMLADAWNHIRVRVANEFDYHFSLECDEFCPPDTLIRLMAHATVRNYPVVGFTYPLRGSLAGQLCIFDYWHHSKSHHTMMTPQQSLQFLDGSTKPCAGVGQGCVLIDSSVYGKIKFKAGDETGWCDSHFYQDLAALKIPVYCDTSLLIDHHD